MFKKLTTGAAALALVGLTAPALADDTSDNEGTITVSVTVDSIVVLTIDDNAAGINTISNLDSSDNTTGSSELAGFTVQANVGYDVDVSTDTWTPTALGSSDVHVKFETSSDSSYMGGNIYLVNPSGTEVAWDATNGDVSSTGSAGTDEWDLGAIFMPDYAGTSSDSGAGTDGLIAPEGDYSATATVTVSESA